MQKQTFLNEATFEALLGTRPFLRIGDGLLFYHEEMEKYVIAQFEDDVEYTVDDFYQLPEEVPYQLINGKFVYTMGASLKHQEVSMILSSEIFNFVRKNNLGKVFHAPTDIVLGEKDIYQPDILYISVARRSQMEKNRIIGAPEFVVEILSQSTEKNDRNVKMTQYGLYDVVEYWIVHPDDEFIEVYYNSDKKMQLAQTASSGDMIVSKAIEGFELEVDKIF